MFGRKSRAYATGYDQCCETKAVGAEMGAYALASAIRDVARTEPEQYHGPKQLLIAEAGSITNERDIPANVTVIYVAKGAAAPIVVPSGF
jgi:hypothetical protein